MSQSRIVVGVVPGQPTRVIEVAAEFARDLDAELVCANVDVSRYATEFLPNGFMMSMPIDTELPDPERQEMPPELEAHIATVLGGLGVEWSVRSLAGDPALALAKLADDVEARAVLVGTREPGFLASLEEAVTGSVAAHLAHKQCRPVIVVPLAPREPKEPKESRGAKPPKPPRGSTGNRA